MSDYIAFPKIQRFETTYHPSLRQQLEDDPWMPEPEELPPPPMIRRSKLRKLNRKKRRQRRWKIFFWVLVIIELVLILGGIYAVWEWGSQVLNGTLWQ
jgi:hypothetical protein